MKRKPYKILSKKETKLKKKPWISKTILASVKIRSIQSILFILNEAKIVLEYCQNICKKKKIFWYERYKFYRNRINKLISKSKKKSSSEIFQYDFQNSRGTWKKVNEILNKNPNKNDNIVINENGTIIYNQ